MDLTYMYETINTIYWYNTYAIPIIFIMLFLFITLPIQKIIIKKIRGSVNKGDIKGEK